MKIDRASGLRAGREVIVRRTFTQQDFNRFAALSGDDNPIHVDPDFSARTRFGKTVSHGMLLYGVIWSALQAHFPGAVQLDQDLMFPAPTYVGEEMSIRLRVLETDPATGRIHVEAILTRPNGEIGCQGQTWLEWTRT